MEQKIIITDSEYEIQKYLDMGWRVISITPQYVSTAAGGQRYGSERVNGKFCFLLERNSNG